MDLSFSRFRIRQQQPLLQGLGNDIQLTDNLFRPRWFGAGDRRLKNVVVFLQLSQPPTSTATTTTTKTTATTEDDAGAVEEDVVEEAR